MPLAVRPPNTSEPCKAHKVYKYHLRGMEINKANQVWSTDITYIKLPSGMAYLAAIIDWHSKAVLSWKIANTMDTSLVTSVLIESLEIYGSPQILDFGLNSPET